MKHLRRESPALVRTWALGLVAAVGLLSGCTACGAKSEGPPGGSQPGAGSERAVPPVPGSDSPAVPAGSGSTSDPGPPPLSPPSEPSVLAGSPDASAPAPAGEPRALTDDEVRTLVTPQLRAGEALAHKPFRAPLGPSPDAVLVIVERDGAASGFVLLPGAGSGARPARKDLPPLSQGLLESVPAILFTDADGEPGAEAIIMTLQMTGAGPQGATARAFNQVIAWRGSTFVRLSDVEEDLLDLETAAAIRKALRARAAKQKAK